ncbi:MAG: hypothetical protein DCC43_10740 [Candidatus Brocadia sp.]|nr:hypothetical protein [Anaerolineales bacterium]MCC6326740.1 hypothetical protein [Candidatus Brocadia sp.]MCE7912463.1 hypothetical protein [Candidatus Brocadia sp. AMX3]MDG5997961.1 hypothetical protein [Candidatus Brocadia sp.]RIJ96968.1 MAG: hypothetical protein DCC43_10740 [Candidatus Brocadia sp.]
MKKVLWLLTILGIPQFLFVGISYCEEGIYYARCNLKVFKGNYITWVNWQDSQAFIPVGTKLKVTRSGSKASLINAETGDRYTLDIGAKGDEFLEKYVIKKQPVDIVSLPKEIQASIKNTTAEIGMTKEHVYMSMGPPIGPKSARTNKMTYEDIMNINMWVYAKRRFQNINITFDANTGKAKKVEGIWK